MAARVTLPPAEDDEELAMDRRPIRFSLDLDLPVYRLLCEEQNRRRNRGIKGPRGSIRAIIIESIYAKLGRDE